MNYNKLLLDELRFVTYEKRNSELTDDLLAKAVTLNENLLSLGYMLAPSDIASIAASPSLDSFYEKVKGMMDTVDADPMYPGFPQQVIRTWSCLSISSSFFTISCCIAVASSFPVNCL